MLHRRHAVQILSLSSLLASLAGPGHAQDAVHCGTDRMSAGSVSRVVDGRTFVLDDGREIRLAAIEVPPGIAGKDAVAALLDSGQLLLKPAETPADRYGRTPAYAYVVRDGTEHSVQADMLAQGQAWVTAPIGNQTCAGDLRVRENVARKAALGLWGDPYYGMKKAENPADVLARRGHFALVEGKVLSVRESGATIYVNFGRRWSEDFTVTILKRNERKFTAAGLAPKSLAGRQVRVRGWIEERGGPWIEAMYPEQIEWAAGD
jgi:endonuclease YncB( thermonuclease family)